jgi:hypothetical protein
MVTDAFAKPCVVVPDLIRDPIPLTAETARGLGIRSQIKSGTTIEPIVTVERRS